MMRALSLFLLLAAGVPEERLFGDWAAACDNVKRCEAVALQPSAQFGDDPVQMTVTRDPGPAGAVTIMIAPRATPGRAMIEIDGKAVTPGVLLENGAITLNGSAAEGLARAMAGGRRLTVRDFHNKRVAAVSLAGSSAALRWIDAEQGRAGTLTALVARGTKQVSAVPRAAPLPAVPAVRAPKGTPPRIAPALFAEMERLGDCEAEIFGGAGKPEIARLDARASLVLIPCGSGAYNFNSAAFVVSGGRVAPARFDVGPGWADAGGEPPILTNAGWDAAGSILSHFAKGRGIGDCGESQQWVWDGTAFRLILATRLNECRGAIEWPTVYRATPAWR